MQRALQVARARSTVDCSCQALSARAFRLRRGFGGQDGASAPGQPRSGFRGVDPARDRPCSAHVPCRFLPAAKTDATGVLNPGLLDAAKRRETGRPGSESCGSRSCPPKPAASEDRGATSLCPPSGPAIVRSTTAEALRATAERPETVPESTGQRAVALLLRHWFSGFFFTRAREEKKRCPRCRMDLKQILSSRPPPNRPRQVSEFVIFSRGARPENKHRNLPPMAARFRHISQSDRVATPYGLCAPGIQSAVAKCRRFSRPYARPPPFDETPSACQPASRFTESSLRSAPQRSAMCRLCSGPGIRFAGYPDHHSSQHFAEEFRHRPRRPRSGLLPQSRRRDMPAADRSA